MRLTFLILISFVSPALSAQTKPLSIVNKSDSLNDPFQNLTFDRVIAFNFNYDTLNNKKRHDYIEFGDNLSKFNFYATQKSSPKTLDSGTIKDLIEIVNDTSTKAILRLL